jgi:hypothetical protein
MASSPRRPSRQTLKDDTHSMAGLDNVPTYSTERPEATRENIRETYNKMIELQTLETEQAKTLSQTTSATREAEIAFHKAIVAMREVVKGQYGPNSLEVRHVGLTRTDDRKPPKRK